MKKILLYGAIALSLNSFAQTPTYVPSNGLVGWWPFNGNANDESGNGNNGIVNGATLTTDRFGAPNAAYDFLSGDYIDCNQMPMLNAIPQLTLSVWVKADATNSWRKYISKEVPGTTSGIAVQTALGNFGCRMRNGANTYGETDTTVFNTGIWYHVVMVFDGNEATDTEKLKIYIDGNQKSMSYQGPIPTITASNTASLYFGYLVGGSSSGHDGTLDDIGIWSVALTPQEITTLYNSVNCANNTIITPQINSLSIGSAASFTATTSDPSPSFIWQSDFGQGFQSLYDFGNYSGVNTNMLSLANVQLSEHNQEIRAISTSGNCIDTSNVAVINILDTCITNVTVTDTTYIAINDTTFISVTDTLIINAILTGLNPPNNQNTLKVFPNPASTHITIDYGNFSSMGGYTLKITNNIGQVVFTTPINQQSSYIDLSTWSGTGIYFVEIIDTQNNTIENRKILIQ